MVGVIILTHGLFGEEIYKAVEMIIGNQNNVEILSIKAGSSVLDVASNLETILDNYEKDGCIVFTDMFGGSPSNISMAYLQKDSVEVVSGVNLPMLLKFFAMRSNDKYRLSEIASEVAKAGIESIKVAGDFLKKRV